jgi:hypothetical protein
MYPLYYGKENMQMEDKFKKRAREARKDFKEVKDKKLGKGLIQLIRGLKKINRKLNVIIKNVKHS